MTLNANASTIQALLEDHGLAEAQNSAVGYIAEEILA